MNSNQPAYLGSLINLCCRTFAILDYPFAQAVLNPLWVHMSKSMFSDLAAHFGKKINFHRNENASLASVSKSRFTKVLVAMGTYSNFAIQFTKLESTRDVRGSDYSPIAALSVKKDP